MTPYPTPRLRPAALALVALLVATPGHAAYISELFQSGPAGQGIEIAGVDPAQGATLAILDGSRYDTIGFGQVLELIHLPAQPGSPPIVFITDTAWPDASVQSTALADLPNASGQATLALGGTHLDRLLLVFDGVTDLLMSDNPVQNGEAQARYNTSVVTDWLAIGPGNLSQAYASSGHDLAAINSALGIDLLARTADREAGQVVARAHLPGQAMDLDALYVGNPDDASQYAAGTGLTYQTTPGHANLPLLHPAPEPGSAAGFLAGAALFMRRRRAGRCSQ